MSAIADDFAEHGADAIARVGEADPASYVRIVGSFVPRELVVQRETDPNVDIDNMDFSGFMKLVEQARQRQLVRSTLAEVEPSAQIAARK